MSHTWAVAHLFRTLGPHTEETPQPTPPKALVLGRLRGENASRNADVAGRSGVLLRRVGSLGPIPLLARALVQIRPDVVAPAGDHCLPLATRFRLAENLVPRSVLSIELVSPWRPLKNSTAMKVSLSRPNVASPGISGANGRPPSCRSAHPDRCNLFERQCHLLTDIAVLGEAAESLDNRIILSVSASLSFRKCFRR